MPTKRPAPLRLLPRMAEANLSAAIRDFLDHHEAKNTSQRTRENYREALDQLNDHLASVHHSRDIREIRRPDLQGFFIALQRRRKRNGEPISASTVQNRYRAIRAFFRWAASASGDHLIASAPTEGLPLPKAEERLPAVLTVTEILALMRATDGTSFEARRDKAIFAILFDTGLRLAELSSLRVDSLNRDERQITVRGKGNRIRVVKVGPSTSRAITKYLTAREKHEDHDLPQLWLGRRGALAMAGIVRAMQRRAKEARVEGWHAHRARHTWGHLQKRGGVSYDDLATLGGWRPNSPMLYRYGASAASDRALDAYRSPLETILSGGRE